MPRRPPSLCTHPECGVLVAAGTGPCGKHRLESSTTTRLVLVKEEPEDFGGDAA